jgi:hypothetical protein
MDQDRVDRIRAAVGESLDRIKTHRFIRCAHSLRLSEDQCHRWIMCAGRESRIGRLCARAGREPANRNRLPGCPIGGPIGAAGGGTGRSQPAVV